MEVIRDQMVQAWEATAKTPACTQCEMMTLWRILGREGQRLT